MKTCRKGMVGEALVASALFAIFLMPAHGLAQTSESDVDFPGRPQSDVAVSWQKGTAHVPGKFLTTSPDEIKTDKPLPVVLYLHGCDGIGKTDRRWASFLKDLGFIVVQPDSMKRDRPISCDPAGRRGGLFPGVYRLRLEEVSYAREQIAKAAWADGDKIFLMGHSEGGITVSLVTRDDFRGAIISAWHCGTTGLRTAAAIPILAIDHESDPWFAGVQGGGCAKHFGDRHKARMITLPGHAHDSFEPPAKEALSGFLKEIAAQTPR
jgi:poly(3-hydroxybutyrate) depolymerase